MKRKTLKDHSWYAYVRYIHRVIDQKVPLPLNEFDTAYALYLAGYKKGRAHASRSK